MSRGGVVDKANAGFEEDRNEEFSPFQKSDDCPVRITSIFGYDKQIIIATAEKLIKDYNWKFHSEGILQTLDSEIFSIILWNTKP